MLFTRTIFTLSCIMASVVHAAPILSSTTSTIHQHSNGVLLTESLSEYYENIVDQVMLDVSENVLIYLPEAISHNDIEARQSAQKSLSRNLNFMRASLLASVNPLVSTDIPQIAGFNTIEQSSQVETLLQDSITTLNKKMSRQLGLIVNAQQSTAILIRQANSYPLQKENKQPTVITVEWKLRQPFQINVVREEQKIITANTVEAEAQWLLEQLSSVEQALFNEFNDRIVDAVQLVMEALALDI